MTFDPSTLPDEDRAVYEEIKAGADISVDGWTGAAWSAINLMANHADALGEAYRLAMLDILLAKAPESVRLNGALYDMGVPIR